jgi:hypothetical protein
MQLKEREIMAFKALIQMDLLQEVLEVGMSQEDIHMHLGNGK